MGFDFILHNLHTPSWYWTYMWDVSFVWRGVFLRTFQISLASSASCIRGLCSIWPFILVPGLQPTDWSFWLFTTKFSQLLKASCSKISIRHQSVAAYPERNETFPPWYCGWASKILHRLVDGKHPIIYRVSTFQGGWGFLPWLQGRAQAMPTQMLPSWWTGWDPTNCGGLEVCTPIAHFAHGVALF